MAIDSLAQIITGATTVSAALFFTIRYSIKETNKSKDSFLKYLQEMQTQQLDYYENKNGHLERISKDFTKTINKNSAALDKLTKKVESYNRGK